MNEPRTLQEAILYFADPDNCLNYMVARRWPDGVVCPTCGRTDVTFLTTQRKWQCKSSHVKRQFTAKVGTLFEDSPLGLEKWLPAVWMITNDKNGISSYELARSLGVTQKTAWFMLHRIRAGMQSGAQSRKLSGHVEVDETFIGGKARNMHASKRREKITGRGPTGKVVVMGVLQRGGNVRVQVIVNGINPPCMGSSRPTSAVGWKISGPLLKRGLSGTYVSVEPFHLFRYIDEQVFRYNNRGDRKKPVSDAQRFTLATSQLLGKRLTCAELTGKVGETQAF